LLRVHLYSLHHLLKVLFQLRELIAYTLGLALHLPKLSYDLRTGWRTSPEHVALHILHRYDPLRCAANPILGSVTETNVHPFALQMRERGVFPGFRQEIGVFETEQLRTGSRGVWEVSLEEEPPVVRDASRGEGEEVARLELVAL